jgi:hypothetical protein
VRQKTKKYSHRENAMSDEETSQDMPELAKEPDGIGGEQMESEFGRARRLREEAQERENEMLLRELPTGGMRVLKRDGAGRISARKLLDEVSGQAVIVRFTEYGENPYKPVYFLVDETRVEAMVVPGGAIVATNGVPVFVPGAQVVEDAQNQGYFKIV